MSSFAEIIYDNIKNGSFIFSIVSCVFSLILIIWFIRVKELRSLTYYFLLCIAISEIIGNIGLILFNILKSSDYILIIINTMEIYSDSTTIIFLFMLNFCIFGLVRQNNKKLIELRTKFILYGHLCSIIYTSILIVGYIFFEKGNSFFKTMFYHSNDTFSKCEITHLSIMTIISIINFTLICTVVSFIRQKAKKDPQNAKHILSVCSSLFNFPLVGFIGFFFSWFVLVLKTYFKIFPLIDTLFQIRVIQTFSVLSTVFTASRGFLLFLIFISTKKVREQIYYKKERILRNIQQMNMFQVPASALPSKRKKSSFK